MRSLIYERLAIREEMQLPPLPTDEGDMLFFGCRNREADYFFEEEWKTLTSASGLSVFPAFSRDQVGNLVTLAISNTNISAENKSVCSGSDSRPGQAGIPRSCRSSRSILCLWVCASERMSRKLQSFHSCLRSSLTKAGHLQKCPKPFEKPSSRCSSRKAVCLEKTRRRIW